MAKTTGLDAFANLATINNVESAANTLTYKKLETGISVFEKVAWIIHRIQYFFAGIDVAYLNGNGDSITAALLTANTAASINGTAVWADPTMIDNQLIQRNDIGVAASGFFFDPFITKDFNSLPSGGLIVPPSPLFGAIQGAGNALAQQCIMRIYYTVKELAVEEYWQLVESRRSISA